MRRVLSTVLACLLFGVSGIGEQASNPVAADRIWFSPNPGTLDLLDMFERPDEWQHARALMSVYNFTQQHTHAIPDSIVGPNTYDALVRVDAFRKLGRWGKKISIGVGAVKEFYCTADDSGMKQSVTDTLNAIRAVISAGGFVNYLSMDEPWVSGRSRRCGGPALEPTADRVQFYMSAVNRAYPRIRIGLIEAYPFSSADQIESMIAMMRARGLPPACLHRDVDWHALKPGDFERDMKALRDFCRAGDIPFGIIITGYNGDSSALFADDAYGIARMIGDTFLRWDDMPDHLMFDSWVQSSTGLNITPSNLPDGDPYTQTSLLVDIFRYLRGLQKGVPSAAAIRR
jgi:hypothetical protein